MAERSGEDITNEDAMVDYLDSVLAESPKERRLRLDTGAIPRIELDPDTETIESGTFET